MQLSNCIFLKLKLTKIDLKGKIVLGDSMKSKDKSKKHINIVAKKIAISCIFLISILCIAVFYNKHFRKNNVYATETATQIENIKISNAKPINLDEIINKNSKEKEKIEYSTEEIELEYLTKYKDNELLPKGMIQVIQEGRQGKQQIVKRRVYNNDELISEEQVSCKVTKAALNKIVEVGTAKYKSNYKIKVGDTLYVTSDRLSVMVEPNEQSR